MIAIVLLYFWCKSYMATTKHKNTTYNTLNFSNLYFLKSRKVRTWKVFQNQVTYIDVQKMQREKIEKMSKIGMNRESDLLKWCINLPYLGYIC